MFNKNWWFLNFQKEFLNFSFCIRKLAVAFYMINEIQPKIKFQNIVQCPFNVCISHFLLQKSTWILATSLTRIFTRMDFQILVEILPLIWTDNLCVFVYKKVQFPSKSQNSLQISTFLSKELSKFPSFSYHANNEKNIKRSHTHSCVIRKK